MVNTYKVEINGEVINVKKDSDGKFIIPEKFMNNHTAIKPAIELWTLARKPLSEDTIADNILKWGTGGLNIEDCRVESSFEDKVIMDKKSSKNPTTNYSDKKDKIYGKFALDRASPSNPQGRFPANLIHDGSDEVVGLFPETGASKASARGGSNPNPMDWGNGRSDGDIVKGHNDNGGSAARYFKVCPWQEEDFKPIFYCPKASKKERTKTNNHPTVKPLTLIEYLITLITPKNGIVLDPYVGSGTTIIACKKLNRSYVCIENEMEYCDTTVERVQQCLMPNK